MLKLKRLTEAKVARLGEPTKRLMTDSRGRQIYVDQPGGVKLLGMKKSRIGRQAASKPKSLIAMRKGKSKIEAVQVDGEAIEEGDEKKHHTPEFVRHCVTAITEKPKDLERVKQDAPGSDEGSPFAICWAKYKGNKRSLAAKHAKGKHHTVSQYKKALATLREDLEKIRGENIDRRKIMHSDVGIDPAPSTRHLIRYAPEA